MANSAYAGFILVSRSLLSNGSAGIAQLTPLLDTVTSFFKNVRDSFASTTVSELICAYAGAKDGTIWLLSLPSIAEFLKNRPKSTESDVCALPAAILALYITLKKCFLEYEYTHECANIYDTGDSTRDGRTLLDHYRAHVLNAGNV